MTIYALHWFLPLPEPIAIPEIPGILHFTFEGAGPGLEVEVHLTPHHLIRPSPEPDGFTDAIAAMRTAMPILNLEPESDVSPSSLERAVTVLEAVVMYPDGQRLDEGMMSAGFDRALESIAMVQRGYHAATKRDVRIIQREQLPVFVPCAVLSKAADGGWEAEDGMRIMLAHPNVPSLNHPEQLGESEWNRVLFAIGMAPAPYFNLTDLRREAGVALSRGEYGAAAVVTATASEIFLETMLLTLLWEESKTPDEAAAVFSNRGGMTGRVKTEYHPRIGGSWKLDGNSPVARWWLSTAKLRHRVVHAAYRATRPEAVESLDALIALEKWVADMLCKPAKLKIYPASTYLYASETGLRRRKVSERKIAEILETARDQDWMANFVLWRSKVIELRSEA